MNDPWTKSAWAAAYAEYPDVALALRAREQQPGAAFNASGNSAPGPRWVAFMELREFCNRNKVPMYVEHRANNDYVRIRLPGNRFHRRPIEEGAGLHDDDERLLLSMRSLLKSCERRVRKAP